MKIALVTETFLPSTDGIVTRLCATIDWLRQQGHSVRIIAPDLGVAEYAGAAIVGIPARTFLLYRGKKFAFPSRKVKSALQQFQPDLVHVVNPAFLGVSGIYYSRILRLPLVASYHTQIPHYADYYHLPFLKPALWWFFRTLHNRADLNLCTSLSVQKELQGRRFRNVRLWNRGVDPRQFGPQYRNEIMRKMLTNGRSDKTLLLYVGRLAPEKNIEMLREVLAASADYCLAIVGDGPHRARLEKHFQGTSTVFTGFMHGEKLAQAYASSDLFVFPSVTETLGLVILEAMASGLPVIAARSGPTEEQVRDGVTGILFDAEDRGGMTKAVKSLSSDPELKQKISVQARQHGCQFSWSGPSEQLLAYYKEVIHQAKERMTAHVPQSEKSGR
jgi:glycosyltransferase involved in cell wall biosynthesis